MKQNNLLYGIFIALSFALSIIFYQQLPDRFASHWNTAGEVNGTMSTFWGAFLMPLLIAGLALLFIAIPKIDPLKMNIAKFQKQFDHFIIVLFLFMLGIHVHLLLWNVGVQLPTNFIVPLGLSALFYSLGILMEHAKRNWFIGIRTPWTLSSDRVWDKTHKVGAKLFKWLAVLALVIVVLPKHMMYLFVIPVVIGSLYLVVYSYLEYRNERK